PEGKSVSSIRMLCVDMGSTSYPSPLLKYDSSTKKLEYSVIVRDTSTTGKLTISSPIVSVKLDGKELLADGQKLTYFEGTTSYEASGTYTLTAVNENGKEAVATLVIPEMPIEFKGEALVFNMVTETEDGTDNDDGKLTVREDQIIGGVRDGDSKRADYEYALVPSGETPAEWQDGTEFTGLSVGKYDLHIRDANDPDNVLVIGVAIGYESVRIDDIHSEPTSLAYHSGSISVNAQGGYSELEYSYVPAGAEISDNGTPGDDSDDEVIYAGITYPLWTSRSVMNDLPEGIYTVNVRETENHDNSISRQILVPHVVTITEVRTVPVQNAENNGQIIVIATGGYGALEYSFVPDGAEISDNGTPDDDSDDMVLYKGAEYPLWMPESQMNTMPVGMYTVYVRDERLTTVRMTDVDVPDHMVIRVETVPTYEDESTGSVEVLALGGYGAFEYCYLPLAEDGTLRSDVVIGSADDEDYRYQTITFNGREEAPLWTTEYNFTDLPKGSYMIIVRDTMDPMNSEKVYPNAEELLKMTENQYTAVAFAEIRNHDKFEITVTGDIGTDLSPEGVTRVQRHRGLTVTILPKSGFQLERILIDGRMMSNVYGSYTFENVNEPHTVQVFSKQLETIPDRLFPLYVSSTEGGSVSYEGRLIAAYGSSRKLEITADEGWRIADVLVDGESVGAVSSYEFRAIIDEHTLHVVFEKIEDDVNP
ncbi:MAG: hypothetical protein II333_08560, partial [Clostridia bacterium]|nr:hypothetical protein [Clostridia bacterium]